MEEKTWVVGRPYLYNKELYLKRVSDIIDSSRWGNNGQYVQQLEAYICEYLGCNHCVLVNNATIGLELALKVIPKLPSKALTCLVPSFTFVATVSALKTNNITPVFADIDDDYCMTLPQHQDYDLILPVNLFGNLCSPDIYDSPVPKLFDDSHAMAIYHEYRDSYVGADCDISVFSLHSTKIMGSGECGFITCKDENTATYLRELRNFGYHINSGAREGEVVSYGTNAKVSEITAAFALTQLENAQEIQEHHFNVHQAYEEYLPDLVKPKNNLFSNWSYVVLEVENRDRLITELNKSRIFPRTYFTPIHTMRPYRSNYSLPNTERIASRIMSLPTGLTIDPTTDVKYICDKLKELI